MYWSNFIHIYQPPTQTQEILEKVANESYRPILKILKQYNKAKLTVNINASLTEQLAKYGFNDVIEDLATLAENKRIEFTASAKYHPILPLIPEGEIKRQIELNTETNQKYFGNIYNPTGFFPPEMCYNSKVGKIVYEMGYKWIIIDEIGFCGKLNKVKNNRIYEIEGLKDFYVFFKEREISAGLTYGKYPTRKEFINALGSRINENFYLLSGTDGEIYGHHRVNQELLLLEVYKENMLKTCTITELFSLFNKKEKVNPLSSSWSSWEEEIEEGIPFPQWDFAKNEIHSAQWMLAYLAIDLINSFEKKEENCYLQARELLDKGLHSCQWWWASCRPWWSTDMIAKGAEQLYSSIDAIADFLKKEDIAQAKSLKNKIILISEEWQVSGRSKVLKEEYKKRFTEVTTELTFG